MKRPILFVAAVATVGLAASALTASAQVYPTPPTTSEPAPVPAGECELVGTSIPGPDGVLEPTLIVRCAISDTTTRLFEMPLSDTDVWVLSRLLEVVGDSIPDSSVTVH